METNSTRRTFTLASPHGECIGTHNDAASAVRGIYIHGFRSNIASDKAEYLSEYAAACGYDWVNFDLPCHGKSDGAFREFAISDALETVSQAIQKFRDKPIVLIGSSMGAWLSMLAARKFAGVADVNIVGAVLIAPAFDFFHEYFAQAAPAVMEEWQRDGVKQFTDEYTGEQYELNYAVVADGLAHKILTGELTWHFPITIFHGEHDEIVPIKIPRKFHQLSAPTSQVTLNEIPAGDHSLNECLPQVAQAVDNLFTHI